MFLAEVWSALSALIFPSRSIEVPPPLPLIFSAHRKWDTEVFLSLLWDQAIHSEDPSLILNGFPVTTMTFRKAKDTATENEFLILQVPVQDQVQNTRFVLECTVSIPAESNNPDNDTIDRFLNHPDSRRLLRTILDNFQTIPLSVSAAAAQVPTPMSEAASVIIPLTGTSSSLGPHLPVINKGPNTPSSHFQTSLILADVLQRVSDSQVGHYMPKSLNTSKLPKDFRAEDNFKGADRLNSAGYSLMLGTELGEFRPKHLKLFHLALLAHVVHVQYPLYALFMSQSYWFASIIFSAAQIIDRDLLRLPYPTGDSSEDTFDKKIDQIYLPFHLYMPAEAGCWKGIRISGCKKVVLDTIVREFREELRGYIIKVFSVALELLLSKILIG
jgi:hypothetical protein